MYLIFDRSLPKQQDRRKVQKLRSGSYIVFKDEISSSLYVLCNNIMARSWGEDMKARLLWLSKLGEDIISEVGTGGGGGAEGHWLLNIWQIS